MKNKIKFTAIILLLFAMFFAFGRYSESSYFSFKEDIKNNNTIEEENLQLTMLALDQEGDCTLIKYGNTEVLIDAGGTNQNCAKKVYDLVDSQCTDNVLEYIIITHAHEDHYKSFYSSYGLKKWLSEEGNVGDILIDFDINEDDTVTTETFINKSMLASATATYTEYTDARDYLLEQYSLSNGNNGIRKHIVVTQCNYDFRNIAVEDRKKDEDIKGVYPLYYDEVVSNASLNILYNYYSDHSLDGVGETTQFAGDHINIMSMCIMIKFYDYKFLFTGDLEEFNSGSSYKRIYGESKLVENNYDELKDGVFFFKAAHHGSLTSNSENLLDVIRPQYIGINAVATLHESVSTKSLKFPKQVPVNNMLKWTDYLLITNKYQVDSNGKETSLVEKIHGTINFKLTKEDVYVNTETNAPISAYENEWFYNNRVITNSIYNLDTDENGCVDCTYIKIGHIDILVGVGITLSKAKITPLINKIEKLCNDRVLDILIVSNFSYQSLNCLYSKVDNTNKAIFYNDYFKDISLIIEPSVCSLKDDDSVYVQYQEGKENLINKFLSNGLSIEEANRRFINYNMLDSTKKITLINNDFVNYSITLLNSEYNNRQSRADYKDYSLKFLYSIFDKKINENILNYLNVGMMSDYKQLSSDLLSKNSNLINKINIFQIPYHGYMTHSTDDFNKFIDAIRYNKDTINFILLYNGKFGSSGRSHSSSGTYFPSKKFKDLEDRFKKVFYATSAIDNGSIVTKQNGDLRVILEYGVLAYDKKTYNRFAYSIRGSRYDYYSSINSSNSYEKAQPLDSKYFKNL